MSNKSIFDIPDKLNIIVSPQLAVTPWIEHTDGTRLQMGSNHKKQALKLVNAEIPYITTGLEEDMRRFTSSVITSEISGNVMFIDKVYNVIGIKDNNSNGCLI